MFEDEKKHLRVVMKKTLASLTDDERREKSARIVKRFVKLKSYQKAKAVAAYASFGTEVSTDALLDCIQRDGKRLVLPRLNPFDNTLVLHEVSDLASDLEPNKFGIREPKPTLPVVSLKGIPLIAVPGLAFNEYGTRLGRGLGCYDKLIADGGRKNKFVALAFDVQVLGEFEIPEDMNDLPVDLIVTESKRINPDDALNEFYEANKEFVDEFAEQIEKEGWDSDDTSEE